jgi:hypothetical protein
MVTPISPIAGPRQRLQNQSEDDPDENGEKVLRVLGQAVSGGAMAKRTATTSGANLLSQSFIGALRIVDEEESRTNKA